jgi:DDE superfamily endonuclease
MSMSAAIAYRWDGSHSRLFFQMKPGSYDTDSLIPFLMDLHREMRGQKVILIWDGLMVHRSRKMNEFVHSQRSWLEVERLPAYSPDLNPVEDLWGNIKGQELANRCVNALAEMTGAARRGIARVQRRQGLLFGFLKHAGLSL